MRAVALALILSACQPLVPPCETEACLAYRASLYQSYMLGGMGQYHPAPFYAMPTGRY